MKTSWKEFGLVMPYVQMIDNRKINNKLNLFIQKTIKSLEVRLQAVENKYDFI